MNLQGLLGGAALVLAMGASQAQAEDQYQVKIEHAAARVVVIPEARSDVAVTISHGPSRLPQLQVRREGGQVIVDGGLGDSGRGDGSGPLRGSDHVNCVTRHAIGSIRRESQLVIVRGVGEVAYGDLPVITVHTPMNVHIGASSAVYGEVGRSESLELASSGCGDWTAAEVRGRLAFVSSGSGNLKARSAGGLTTHMSGSGGLEAETIGSDVDAILSGSGNIKLGEVRGGLHTKNAGSGDITVASVDGPVESSIAGSGNVRIHGGRAPNVKASVAGSGGLSFDGEAGALSGSVAGSGDIYVASVTGPVSRSVTGSGTVRTGP
jgi:hypothetical protein